MFKFSLLVDVAMHTEDQPKNEHTQNPSASDGKCGDSAFLLSWIKCLMWMFVYMVFV